jgi:hypothetical protein
MGWRSETHHWFEMGFADAQPSLPDGQMSVQFSAKSCRAGAHFAAKSPAPKN